jgi:hypothetical protein
MRASDLTRGSLVRFVFGFLLAEEGEREERKRREKDEVRGEAGRVELRFTRLVASFPPLSIPLYLYFSIPRLATQPNSATAA